MKQLLVLILVVILASFGVNAQAQDEVALTTQHGCFATLTETDVNMRSTPQGLVVGQWNDTDESVRHGMEFMSPDTTRLFGQSEDGLWLLAAAVREDVESPVTEEDWILGWVTSSAIELEMQCELPIFYVGTPAYWQNDPDFIVYVAPGGEAGIAPVFNRRPYTYNTECEREQTAAFMADGDVRLIPTVEWECVPMVSAAECEQQLGQQVLAAAQYEDIYINVGLPNECHGISLSIYQSLGNEESVSMFNLKGVPFDTSGWTFQNTMTVLAGSPAAVPFMVEPPTDTRVSDPATACNGEQQGCAWTYLVDGVIHSAGEPLAYDQTRRICAASTMDVRFQSAGDNYPVVSIELWGGQCPGGNVITVRWSREGHEYALLFHTEVNSAGAVDVGAEPLTPEGDFWTFDLPASQAQ